jgi:methylenetetrahydrofolate--tRNA-(uracil-5-)-methyltransferase
VKGETPRPAPRTTAIGALAYYVAHANPSNYQPTNITFGIIAAPADHAVAGSKKKDRKAATSERALQALDEWMREEHAPVAR